MFHFIKAQSKPIGIIIDSKLSIIVSEFILGWSLRGKFLSQISSAMTYLHERGLHHRDLRTPNILLDANFDVKVTDFGIAYWAMEGERLDDTILNKPDMCFFTESTIFKILLDSPEQKKRIDFM